MTLIDDDIDTDRWATALANRKTLGWVVDGNGTNHGNMIGTRPMTPIERARAGRPELVPDPPADHTWRTHAACHGMTDLFYNNHNDNQAATICHQCPVMHDCRNWALEYPDWLQHGTAGGLTATARVRVRINWRTIDWTAMRTRRAEALDESWALRHTPVAA